MRLIMSVMAAVFGTFIWEMDRHPSWGPKLNTLITARYWHSFDFEELMFLALGGLIILPDDFSFDKWLPRRPPRKTGAKSRG